MWQSVYWAVGRNPQVKPLSTSWKTSVERLHLWALTCSKTTKEGKYSLGIVCKPGCSRRLVSVQMAIKHVKTEAAHLRWDDHFSASTSRTRSRAEIRGEAGWSVTGRGWGQSVRATATTTTSTATTTAAAAAAAANVTPGSPQAVGSAHVRRCCYGRRGANPQLRATMSGSCHPASRPHPAGTPRPGRSRQFLLLHPAAPGRHLGTICTDTPLPTHNRHRGKGGGERRPDVEIPLRWYVRRTILHFHSFIFLSDDEITDMVRRLQCHPSVAFKNAWLRYAKSIAGWAFFPWVVCLPVQLWTSVFQWITDNVKSRPNNHPFTLTRHHPSFPSTKKNKFRECTVRIGRRWQYQGGPDVKPTASAL